MSGAIKFLHSHSALERERKIPKHVVIVDECYENRFDGVDIKHVTFGRKSYLKVPIMAFINAGGIFKNLRE